VTVNGIGERAGMPDISQVVMSLKIQYGIDLGINLEKLKRLSEIVASATATSVYPWQPVVGRNVFAHESGIHAKGTINNGKTFEPFSPDIIGCQREIVIGKHSGRASLKHALDEQRVSYSEDKLPALLELVREVSMIKSNALTFADVAILYSTIQ
jgi:homocitrate synthase NifV